MPMITARETHYPRTINMVKPKIDKRKIGEEQFNSLSNFMSDKITRVSEITDPQKCLRAIDLFDQYQRYSKDKGYTPIKSRTTFEDKLRKDFGVRFKIGYHRIPGIKKDGDPYKGNKNPKTLLCENIHLKSKMNADKIDKDIKKLLDDYITSSDTSYMLTTMVFALFLVKFPNYKETIDIDSFSGKFAKIYGKEIETVNTVHGPAKVFQNIIPKYEKIINLYRENPSMVRKFTVDEAVELKNKAIAKKAEIVDDIRKNRHENMIKKEEEKKEEKQILEDFKPSVSFISISKEGKKETDAVNPESIVSVENNKEKVLAKKVEQDPNSPVAKVYTDIFSITEEYKKSIEYQRIMVLEQIAKRLQKSQIHKDLQQMWIDSKLQPKLDSIQKMNDIADITAAEEDIYKDIRLMESFHK